MRLRYKKCFTVLLALILTACASAADKLLSEKTVKAETLAETVSQVESLFESVPTVMLAASETDTLRAEIAETGVHISARWSETDWTVYFAVYAENRQMLGAAAAPEGLTAWETEILCEAGQAAVVTVKMFRLDQDLYPVAPAISAPVESNIINSLVYFTADISPEGLVRAYQALNWEPTGRVAVKLSTGEPPNSNYLRPELISDLVQSVNGTIVECNTAYGGSRAFTALHKQVAADHGFTAIADFDLMDEDGEKELPLIGGVRLNRAIVGSHIDNYDSFLILSHFKGHAMAGLGGAIKNVAIGMASARGKVYVHTAGTKTSGSVWYSNQDAWLEALPEMVKAVRDYVGAENIVYVNVMNRLSVDCDCDGNPAEPDMHDIGILASYDPVALDQACVDLVYAAPDGASLIARMERQHGVHALEHGEEIGLGSRTYELVNLDA